MSTNYFDLIGQLWQCSQ